VLGPWVGGRTFNTAGHADSIVALFFTGGYPAVTWVPFVIAGMAVARLDLAGRAARIRLALTGVALAVAGYGGSWLAARMADGQGDPAHPARPVKGYVQARVPVAVLAGWWPSASRIRAPWPAPVRARMRFRHPHGQSSIARRGSSMRLVASHCSTAAM
jgi:hypothetical protein